MIAFYRRKDENEVAYESRDGVTQKVQLVFPGNFKESKSYNWSVSLITVKLLVIMHQNLYFAQISLYLDANLGSYQTFLHKTLTKH